MKNILGLDLGTNSIGWAIVRSEKNENDLEKIYGIVAAGSRIIPMDAAVLGDFAKGNTVSQTADRTKYRSTRRILERHKLRRERLNRVLDVMGFLPVHYSVALTRYGKFRDDKEVRLAWNKDEDGKWQFLFRSSYEEMLADFRKAQPEWLADGGRVPYDWTIYYLRKKALSEAITKQELAWILLNFNQKRGYYQLRGEDEDSDNEKNKLVEYYELKVVDVIDTGERKGKDTWFDVVLENGMVYHRSASEAPDWVGKVKEFIVTTELEKDGSPKKGKDGSVKRSFRMPKEEDWMLLKKKTEADIDRSEKKVGEYIYDALLSNPKQKIRGKFVRTVERKYYKEELEEILVAQKKYIPELNDRNLYADCVNELYKSNDAYRHSIMHRDFTYLLKDNIIFYQRPLKSKKSLIDNCPYEETEYKEKNKKEVKRAAVKCIAKSHPLFQEFRLWQFVSNLRIYERQRNEFGKLRTDVDVTDELIPSEEKRVELFDFLNDRESISQNTLLNTFFKIKKPKGKDSVYPYRWNYVEDKAYPCNETRAGMLARLKKAGISEDFLTKDIAERLWHILYSVEDKNELRTALTRFADKNGMGDSFVEQFVKFPPFAKEYGAYSAKAIKKLLPLMRMGKYWNENAIDSKTKSRIDKIVTGEFDENIKNRVRDKAISLTDIEFFRGLPLWLACYVVYDRHSEAKDIEQWNSPDDIDKYLKGFRHHSLRNPIVEQVITETLRTVRDIWKKYGKIDEVHVELGREMKNTKEERVRRTRIINENENANLRVKALLTEFMNPDFDIEGVRPYSPYQQEILHIYEDTVLKSVNEIPDDIGAIIGKFSQTDVKKKPTRSEVLRYKLWLEQKYRSPYTGEMIPLGKLFTTAYQIEHVIPQSRYFDDSFSNKVICEAEVNKLKDNMLGLEFIKKHHGEKVQLSQGGTVEILSEQEYDRFVQENYMNNRGKMKKLLMDDIPDKFIERQMNDSRYISKVVKSLLSNMVREDDEIDAISKNVIPCSGGITDRLKKDWGVNDVWNRIILPRFRRLNDITKTSKFTSVNSEGHEIPDMPLEMQKGFNKKRIDHRHHAMDAIVIACTTRSHVNLLNNEAAMSSNRANRYQLSRKLRRYENIEIIKNGERRSIDVAKEFIKPWSTFTSDVETALRDIVVSFKHNQRIINKSVNKSVRFVDGKKTAVKQEKGDNWAIRKSMHKETVFGEVNLRRVKSVSLSDAIKEPSRIVDKDIKKKVQELLLLGCDAKKMKKYFEENKDMWQDVNIKKIAVYYFTKETKERFFATRKPIDTSFDRKKIETSVTDTGIQKIMLNHLEANDNDPARAFSPDGIEEMNRNIHILNKGKYHQPIFKVRVYEKADKYAVGQKGNKSSKFVEAAKGTNLFFAVYEDEVMNKNTGCMEKKRSYLTVPLHEVIKRQKEGLPSAPEDVNGKKPKFVLSPNDLVYVPTEDEIKNGNISLPLNKDRIYKMVSCTGRECYFVPEEIASPILGNIEFSSLNKMERSLTGEMIKEICIPIEFDRLGNIEIIS